MLKKLHNKWIQGLKKIVEKSECIWIWGQKSKVKVESVEKVNNEYGVKRKCWNKSEWVLDMNTGQKRKVKVKSVEKKWMSVGYEYEAKEGKWKWKSVKKEEEKGKWKVSK